MKYRIIEHRIYNEYCEVEQTYYTVEELVSKLFGGLKYKTLKHVICTGYDSYKVVTTFKTTDDAVKLIDNLNEGTPRDTVVSTTVIIT